MAFKIQKLLEKGKFNWKGLKNILHDHEARLDALESSATGESTQGTLAYRIKALETILGDSDDDTVYNDAVLSARVSALEEHFTHDLSFTVNDGTDPIQGATVSIASLSKTGTTGSSGGCTISGVLEGTYTVNVTADGYEDYSGSKTVTGDITSFTISLEAVATTEP